ncbi:hypothetical protein L9F63_020606 [Diploptera punctata]|uniref:Uncharacterized protein n=1 Tax=Diploptera punctata TaxID=6984 RepID=A0AAD7ZR03_DIPPU|nr:hypothetical protein L9F63_020606 [Diploptera punctata]
MERQQEEIAVEQPPLSVPTSEQKRSCMCSYPETPCTDENVVKAFQKGKVLQSSTPIKESVLTSVIEEPSFQPTSGQKRRACLCTSPESPCKDENVVKAFQKEKDLQSSTLIKESVPISAIEEVSFQATSEQKRKTCLCISPGSPYTDENMVKAFQKENNLQSSTPIKESVPTSVIEEPQFSQPISEQKRRACLCTSPESPCKDENVVKAFRKENNLQSNTPIKESVPTSVIEGPLFSQPTSEQKRRACLCTSPESPCKDENVVKAFRKEKGFQSSTPIKESVPTSVIEEPLSSQPTSEQKRRGCLCTSPESPCKDENVVKAFLKEKKLQSCRIKESVCTPRTEGQQSCEEKQLDSSQEAKQTPASTLPGSGCRRQTEEMDERSLKELRASLALVKHKSIIKDQLITALTEEVNLHAKSGVFENLLSSICMNPNAFPEPLWDFDKEQLHKYLQKPFSCSAGQPGFKMVRRCAPCCSRGEKCAQTIPSPTGFHVVRQVDEESILLAWDISQQHDIVGYEIYVNDILWHKVHSATRNKALLENLLERKLVILLFAFTSNGCMSLPATITYLNSGKQEAQNKRLCSC